MEGYEIIHHSKYVFTEGKEGPYSLQSEDENVFN